MVTEGQENERTSCEDENERASCEASQQETASVSKDSAPLKSLSLIQTCVPV